MSNTPLEALGRLQVIRHLSTLHHVAVTRLPGEDHTSVRTAYETIADGLHETMVGVALGNDPTVEVEGLQVAWLALSEVSDGSASVLFESWAGKLSGILS